MKKKLKAFALSSMSFAFAAAVAGGPSPRPPSSPPYGSLAPVQVLKLAGIDGEIAVLPSGLAVYTFDPDNAAGRPSCNDACAEKWPPVVVEDLEIKNQERLATVERASGLKQLTIDGKPVYTFYLDRKAGDIKGSELGGVWHLVKLR